MGERQAGALGRDPFATALTDPAPAPVTGGFSDAGPVGADNAIPLDFVQKVKDVTNDWVPTPSVDTSKDYEVSGKKLIDVFNKLVARGSSGEGGGSISNDAITDTTSKELTVALHVKCFRELPKWKERDKAAAGSQVKWDAMLANLTKHENRHVEIIVEAANKLAKDLPGKSVSLVVGMVQAAAAAANAKEVALDNATDNGTKRGVPFGDVFLDTDENGE